MTLLPRLEDLYQLLSRVNQGIAVYHDSCAVHAQGFAWHGADMSEPFRLLSEQALRDGLVLLGVHDIDGSQVSLTATGEVCLRELRAQHDAALRGAA